ncbi:MAG: outer membrane protein assembly factor BamE [Deltaproteobacteria bacterium]|nr:outer membrane protein assembly factor BamE [Deltaproteobacteria bacterium]
MKIIYLTVAALVLASCSSAGRSLNKLHSTEERQLTLGIVQKEIRRGMTQAEVATALGSPNIVSKDSMGQETWIYDKFATEASYANEQGGAGLLGAVGGMAGSVLLLGVPSAHYESSSGASATTQRTLTVVIKFDTQNRVDLLNYHSSRF